MGLLGFVSPYFWFQAPPFSTGIPLSGLGSPHFWIGLPHFSSESPHLWRGVAHFWRGFPHLSPESPSSGLELPNSEVGAPQFWSESPSPGVQLPISAVQLPILAAEPLAWRNAGREEGLREGLMVSWRDCDKDRQEEPRRHALDSPRDPRGSLQESPFARRRDPGRGAGRSSSALYRSPTCLDRPDRDPTRRIPRRRCRRPARRRRPRAGDH